MAVKIFPYRQGSRSARALADALRGRVLRLQGSRYRRRERDTVINWGSSECPVGLGPVLNNNFNTSIAANKLDAFQAFRLAGNVSIPDFYTRREDIPENAFPIVCRTILRGHSGVGIHIAEGPADLVPAPLYVRYVKKQDEYRVHVVRGDVIAVQRKAIRQGFENPNTRVRNHDNGYVFVRGGVEAPEMVLDQARLAVQALGLDFGAADIIWNNRRQTAYVLEVNTAPGLEGQTVQDYAEAFNQITER